MAITRLNNNSLTSITALPSALATTPAFHAQKTDSQQSIAFETYTKVTFNNETMFFSPEYLKSIEYTKTVQSKFGDHSYQLADIRWNPEQKNQDKLF